MITKHTKLNDAAAQFRTTASALEHAAIHADTRALRATADLLDAVAENHPFPDCAKSCKECEAALRLADAALGDGR